MTYKIHIGDCLATMRAMPDHSVDSIVTDPPYELGFMGKGWDSTGIANSVEMWREALRVLKPGGHLLAFSGSRTYHRMVCAIEDAGFEIRDQIMWVYGSGFPKSLDVSKAIDKAAGVEFASKPAAGVGFMGADGPGGYNPTINQLYRTGESTDAARQWQGWGTALKPAHEPIVVARKPLIGTVAANVLRFGTGAINVDGCRVATTDTYSYPNGAGGNSFTVAGAVDGTRTAPVESNPLGRWPANLIHDGSDEVLAAFPADASRFYYAAKASKADRDSGLDSFEAKFSPTMGNGIGGKEHDPETATPKKNVHPTVKPTDLMRYLVRLVTPPGGLVLDPFTGSGSTGKAAMLEGFRFIGCELSPEYAAIAEARISAAACGGFA